MSVFLLTGCGFFSQPPNEVITDFIEKKFEGAKVMINTEKRERGTPFKIKYASGKYLTPGTTVYPVRLTFLVNKNINPQSDISSEEMVKQLNDPNYFSNGEKSYVSVWWFFKNSYGEWMMQIRN